MAWPECHALASCRNRARASPFSKARFGTTMALPLVPNIRMSSPASSIRATSFQDRKPVSLPIEVLKPVSSTVKERIVVLNRTCGHRGNTTMHATIARAHVTRNWSNLSCPRTVNSNANATKNPKATWYSHRPFGLAHARQYAFHISLRNDAYSTVWFMPFNAAVHARAFRASRAMACYVSWSPLISANASPVAVRIYLATSGWDDSTSIVTASADSSWDSFWTSAHVTSFAAKGGSVTPSSWQASRTFMIRSNSPAVVLLMRFLGHITWFRSAGQWRIT